MISNICVFIVAILHLGFLVLEIALWTRPIGRKIFRLEEAFAKQSQMLAANQGLYNGFLAVGLIWSIAQPSPEFAFQLKIFFLSCVIGAGIFGAATVNRRILFIQALPAAIALLTVIFARTGTL